VTAKIYDEPQAGEEPRYSGFGGHLLFADDGMIAMEEDGISDQLLSLGITDAEQLLAMTVIPGVRDELEAMFGEELQHLMDRAGGTLPPDRLTLVSSPAPDDAGLGVLPFTEEMETAAAASAMEAFALDAVALPGAVSLIPFMSAIRNQGGARGTCVSFTLTALNEYVLRRRGLIRDLSEQHLYYEIKLVDGAPNACGTWQVKAVNALRMRGECREHIWPYNANPPCNNHGVRPAQARPDGLNYRLETIPVPTRSVAAYKSHLAQGRPVTLSIPVWRSWYQSAETRRSGRVTMRVGNEPSVGGHAVLLVGYQDSNTSPGGGYFIVRNSWGPGWAYQSAYQPGYGTIPYQYIANEAMEAFTARFQNAGPNGDENLDEEPVNGHATVTIDVAPNIRITISPN
jgi:C1A family cysteine protease